MKNSLMYRASLVFLFLVSAAVPGNSLQFVFAGNEPDTPISRASSAKDACEEEEYWEYKLSCIWPDCICPDTASHLACAVGGKIEEHMLDEAIEKETGSKIPGAIVELGLVAYEAAKLLYEVSGPLICGQNSIIGAAGEKALACMTSPSDPDCQAATLVEWTLCAFGQESDDIRRAIKLASLGCHEGVPYQCLAEYIAPFFKEYEDCVRSFFGGFFSFSTCAGIISKEMHLRTAAKACIAANGGKLPPPPWDARAVKLPKGGFTPRPEGLMPGRFTVH